ncbi:MAG TPA: hypothetical protein VKU41_15090 [Polyangiaceae bacterium]|nr:hypothetical protein [Polyangiaceae bacterium]
MTSPGGRDLGWGRRPVVVATMCAALVGAAVASVASAVSAKASYESPYGYDRTWNAALRLIRVDNGWKVNEKDEANGYLLFDYKSPESAKASPGSLELVRTKDDGASVSVLVQLPQMPHYHEQVLLDSLAAKMRREYGDPPAHRPAPAHPVPQDPVDAGPDVGD